MSSPLDPPGNSPAHLFLMRRDRPPSSQPTLVFLRKSLFSCVRGSVGRAGPLVSHLMMCYRSRGFIGGRTRCKKFLQYCGNSSETSKPEDTLRVIQSLCSRIGSREISSFSSLACRFLRLSFRTLSLSHGRNSALSHDCWY